MSKSPKVTVGLPVYNGERTLSRAIESILAQDFDDFELIISDDCSSDSSLEIIERYAATDSRIKVVKQSINTGYVRQFEFLASAGIGEFFLWAGQDDFHESNYISCLLSVLEPDSKKWLACSSYVPGNNQEELLAECRFPVEKQESVLAMLWNMYPPSWIYGLFRTGALQNLLQTYRTAWELQGGDVLLILACVLEGRVVGSNDTKIFKMELHLEPGESSQYKPRPLVFLTFVVVHLSQAIRVLFGSSVNFIQKILLTPVLVLVMEKRLFYGRAIPGRLIRARKGKKIA